jgi:hypothetical protein
MTNKVIPFPIPMSTGAAPPLTRRASKVSASIDKRRKEKQYQDAIKEILEEAKKIDW